MIGIIRKYSKKGSSLKINAKNTSGKRKNKTDLARGSPKRGEKMRRIEKTRRFTKILISIKNLLRKVALIVRTLKEQVIETKRKINRV